MNLGDSLEAARIHVNGRGGPFRSAPFFKGGVYRIYPRITGASGQRHPTYTEFAIMTHMDIPVDLSKPGMNVGTDGAGKERLLFYSIRYPR